MDRSERTHRLTLSSVVVDVRVVGIVTDGSLKVTESTSGIAYLHMHASNLDQTLDVVRPNVQTLLKVRLGADGIAN